MILLALKKPKQQTVMISLLGSGLCAGHNDGIPAKTVLAESSSFCWKEINSGNKEITPGLENGKINTEQENYYSSHPSPEIII